MKILIFFPMIFLNKDISHNTCRKCLKSSIIILHNDMEETVSQIFNLGPSFYSMETV